MKNIYKSDYWRSTTGEILYIWNEYMRFITHMVSGAGLSIEKHRSIILYYNNIIIILCSRVIRT